MNTDDTHRQRSFEERLLVQLRQVVAARASAQPAPGIDTVHRSGRRFATRARVAVAAGVVGIGAPILATSGGGSPAFAIEEQDDGTVVVTINQFEDADGLEQQLEEHGIPAEVDYTPEGTACSLDRYQNASGTEPVNDVLDAHGNDDGSWSFSVRPASVQDGQSVVIETTKYGNAANGADSVAWLGDIEFPPTEIEESVPPGSMPTDGDDEASLLSGGSVVLALAEGPVAPCNPIPVEDLPDYPGDSPGTVPPTTNG